MIAGDGQNDELKNLGIETVTVPQEMLDNSRIDEKDFSVMTVDPTIDTVVSGYYESWTYHVLCYISLLVRGDGITKGANYVSSNIDNWYSTGERNKPAGGSIMKIIASSWEVNPLSIGKPSKNFFDLIMNDHDLQDESKDKFIMIGDNLATDIAFGINSGIDTLLVLSGITRPDKSEEMLEKFKDFKPTYILNSVKDLVD